jgi:uncharacterized SAM-binding protein YcdF (DUF218 family)
MFFLISKILSFLFNPFNWLVILLLAYVFMKKEALRKKLKITFLIVFFTFSYKPIVLLFISGWEMEGMKLEEVGHHEVGIVLGGGFEYDNDRERLSIRRAGDRVWSAMQLFHQGKLDYILLTGKNGDLIDKGLDESNQLKKILIQNGIPEDRILVDSKSLNTYENAVNSKEILDSLNFNSVLLITSATHMRRAKAVFANQDIDCDIFPTDFYGGGMTWDQFIFPSLEAYHLWYIYFHELFGYAVYGITGKL